MLFLYHDCTHNIPHALQSVGNTRSSDTIIVAAVTSSSTIVVVVIVASIVIAVAIIIKINSHSHSQHVANTNVNSNQGHNLAPLDTNGDNSSGFQEKNLAYGMIDRNEMVMEENTAYLPIRVITEGNLAYGTNIDPADPFHAETRRAVVYEHIS